jgi:hypothetical protein
MRTKHLFLVVTVFTSLALCGFSIAGPKTYQVTGPVIELTDTMIAVKKGEDRWEVARDGKTKVTGDLKVGSKVTIEYTMSAVNVEAKADAPAKKK